MSRIFEAVAIGADCIELCIGLLRLLLIVFEFIIGVGCVKQISFIDLCRRSILYYLTLLHRTTRRESKFSYIPSLSTYICLSIIPLYKDQYDTPYYIGISSSMLPWSPYAILLNTTVRHMPSNSNTSHSHFLQPLSLFLALDFETDAATAGP